MTLRNLERGIEAIQQGNLVEGARLVKIALRDESIQGSVRATAYLWLAETLQDREGKIECYNQALAADPGNEHARQRLSIMLADSLPPVPGASSQAAPPTGMPGQTPGYGQQNAPPSGAPGMTRQQYTQQPQVTTNQTVGVHGGPNGRGTAFFVTRDGLLATTRWVVGGEERVTLDLGSGQQTRPGQVVRSYPVLDLALIYSGLQVDQLLPANNMSNIPPNMPLTALVHDRRPITGHVRKTRSAIPPDWFPTTITEMGDAGGNPVLNDQNKLVGMLTRNANRTSDYLFGLTIQTIYRYAEHYMQEMRLNPGGLLYCSACGNLSRAGTVGGYYCEICGNLLPPAQDLRRRPQPQLAGFYGEAKERPCPKCDARAGYYDGQCLRCGSDTKRK